MSTDLKFVEPADVKTLITGDVKDNVLVVDVRDEVPWVYLSNTKVKHQSVSRHHPTHTNSL